jgi:hypothetical protein
LVYATAAPAGCSVGENADDDAGAPEPGAGFGE